MFVYVPNPFGQRVFERSRDIGVDLKRRGENVAARARANATGIGVQGIPALGIPGPNNPQSRGPRVQTGRLIGSIGVNESADATGLFCDVGTHVWYGRELELGLRNGRTYPFLGPALVVAAN